MNISISRDLLTCPVCHLNQFERGNGRCRRCHHPMGLTYIEFSLQCPLDLGDSQSLAAVRSEVGRLMRKLRLRRGITQAALAAATGIQRTYLSRAECGQVMPSLFALFRIGGALGVDKIMVRVRGI